MKKILNLVFITLILLVIANIATAAENSSSVGQNVIHLTSVNQILKTEQSIPPLSTSKITLEIVGGIGSGMIGGFAGAAVGTVIGGKDDTTGWGDLVGMLCGMVLGYTITSPIGVYLVGNIGDETGSFLATLFGGIMGSITLLVLAEPLNLNENSNLLLATYALISPVTATICFNATRRYDNSHALITLQNEKISFNLPLAVPSYHKADNALICYVNILQTTF